MIIREVLKDPIHLQDFDYFNDFKDTLSWLKIMGIGETKEAFKARELIPILERGERIYFRFRKAGCTK